MKTNRCCGFGLAIALICVGCTSPAIINPTESGRASLVGEMDKVANVRLTEKLAMLEVDTGSKAFFFRVQCGKIFQQLFLGGEHAPAVLDLINATMTDSNSDHFIFWTKSQVIFSVSVSLRAPDGSKHILSSTGAGSTDGGIDRAMREATERAALDLAKQVKAVLSS